MKKIIVMIFSLAILLFVANDARSQTLKVGVFDIDIMVQAMPA
jgi:hypothetical protein